MAALLLWTLSLGACTGQGVVPPGTAAAADSTVTVSSTASAAASTTASPASTTVTVSVTTTPTSIPTSTVPTTAAPPAWWRPATAAAPLRVWLIGDSLAGPLGSALIARAADSPWLHIALEYHDGTGLTRPDVYDWPARVAEVLPEVRPEVVVCLLGANDGQALRLGDEAWEFGTAAWSTEYAARIGAFLDLLTGEAGRVYWVGVPIMADPEYDARVRHINSLLQKEVSRHPDAVYIDGYSLFQDEDGRFADQLMGEGGALLTMRLPDGVHFTGAGADLLAREVLAVLATDWGPGPQSAG